MYMEYHPFYMPPRLVVVACVLGFARLASASCESHCAYPCGELNGPLHIECGDCKAETHRCYPGALDFDTWADRQAQIPQQVSFDENGNQVDTDNPDAPVELTHKSMVMRDKYYAIASPKRTADDFAKFASNPLLVDFLDMPPTVPAESPRHCEVHSCVLIEGDDACAEGHADCDGPRGHLRPFGEQMPLQNVTEYGVGGSDDSPAIEAVAFWRDHIATYEPAVLRGGASQVTELSGWSDEALLAQRPAGSPGGVALSKRPRLDEFPRCN